MKRHFCIAVALSALNLAACVASSPVLGPAGASPAIKQVHSASGRSWMAPGASKGDLLYVTDGISNVYVYTYPKGRLVGTLTGFQSPLGECVDQAGDIFIVAEASRSGPGIIYEYAHGGTQPIATLDDPTFGNGCAIDATSGNLAVTGQYTSGIYAYGDVAVYPGAKGNPVMYYSSTFLPFQLCGYDDHGNLFISGKSESGYGDVVFVELPSGSTTFEEISVDVKLYAYEQPSSVQWDGHHMTVSSYLHRDPTYVYRLRVKGESAVVVGTTKLSSKTNNVRSGQVWVGQHRALTSDVFRGKGGIDSWSYPLAESPRAVIRNKQWDFFPYGIGVSVETQGKTPGRRL